MNRGNAPCPVCRRNCADLRVDFDDTLVFKSTDWEIDESFDFLYKRATVEPDSKLWKPGGKSYNDLRDKYKEGM